MKRWRIAFALALLAALAPIFLRAADPSLLQDSDTRVLLEHLSRRNNPWSWFAGDWPLGNHFYRPISTLFFELDHRFYGANAAGFGLTNALLCAACILLLFWLVREISDHAVHAAAAAVLFSLWTINQGRPLSLVLMVGAGILAFGGFVRHGLMLHRYAVAPLLAVFLAAEAQGMEVLFGRMIAWLPGRTASVMTVFALLAMASYARYERLGASRRPQPEPGPLDPPATRNTVIAGERRVRSGLWLPVSLLATALALGSYEQAVMLPACLLGVAVTMRFQGYRVRWGWQALFWALLLGYLWLRRELVPTDPSGYQLQQFRRGPGVTLALLEYAAPALLDLRSAVAGFMPTWLILLDTGPYRLVLAVASNVAAVVEARRGWILPLAGYLLSLLAFLPMAWLKPFEHYHYWPMALRTMLWTGVGAVALSAAVSALSPRGSQAPPRPEPAPGSLPRR